MNLLIGKSDHRKIHPGRRTILNFWILRYPEPPKSLGQVLSQIRCTYQDHVF